MSLPSQPILIIDQSTESFIEELLNTLVAAGFEPLVAVDEAEALHYLERFDFSAVLLGEQPHFERHLIDAFGGVVVILLAAELFQSGRPGSQCKEIRRRSCAR
jgi:hypothetical protein